jgi:hypothetical protein
MEKMNTGELQHLYTSPDIIRHIKSMRMRWAGHLARMEEGRTCTGFWWESPKEKTTWKTKARWEGRIKMDLRESGCGGGVESRGSV